MTKQARFYAINPSEPSRRYYICEGGKISSREKSLVLGEKENAIGFLVSTKMIRESNEFTFEASGYVLQRTNNDNQVTLYRSSVFVSGDDWLLYDTNLNRFTTFRDEDDGKGLLFRDEDSVSRYMRANYTDLTVTMANIGDDLTPFTFYLEYGDEVFYQPLAKYNLDSNLENTAYRIYISNEYSLITVETHDREILSKITAERIITEPRFDRSYIITRKTGDELPEFKDGVVVSLKRMDRCLIVKIGDSYMLLAPKDENDDFQLMFEQLSKLVCKFLQFANGLCNW